MFYDPRINPTMNSIVQVLFIGRARYIGTAKRFVAFSERSRRRTRIEPIAHRADASRQVESGARLYARGGTDRNHIIEAKCTSEGKVYKSNESVVARLAVVCGQTSRLLHMVVFTLHSFCVCSMRGPAFSKTKW